MSGPFDTRQQFFREHFERALPYEQYVATGTSAQQERWNGYGGQITVDRQTVGALREFTRRMPVLVLSGIWCGDCMRQGPMLQQIAAQCPLIDLRFIDNQENPELRDELRIAGGARVPVALFLSEDFFEVQRFGDRPLSAYRRKAQQELGAACDAGIAIGNDPTLQEELDEWFEIFQRAQLLLRLSPFLRQRHND
jgi:thiol-disulfide isomerase/thioredoxin